MRRIVVAMVMVLLTACGGGGSTSTPPSSVQPATTTTVKTATVGQIASIVAKYNADLRRYAAAAMTCQILLDPRCTGTTRIVAGTLLPTAATLDIELRAAAEDRPNNGLFVGAYPAELVALVSRTRMALDEVAQAGAAGTKAGCTIGTTGDACPTPYLMLGSAAGDLVRQLDAWSPYIH